MDPTEILELQEAITELTEFAPVEPFPVEPLPIRTVTWFVRVMAIFSRHAVLLAFLGAMVENTILLGFLLPGGAMVALAAAGAREANLPLPLIVFFAGLGMTMGATVDYLLGQAGIDRLLHHRWTGRWGKRASQELQQAAPMLSKHGWWVMILAHAFGHGRSALAVAAGASRFGLRRFLAIEFPAAMLWSAIYAGGGYLLAQQWHSFEVIIRRAGWVGTAVLAVTILGLLLWRKRHQQRKDDAQHAITDASSEPARPATRVQSPSPDAPVTYLHPNATSLHPGSAVAQPSTTLASRREVVAPPITGTTVTTPIGSNPIGPGNASSSSPQ